MHLLHFKTGTLVGPKSDRGYGSTQTNSTDLDLPQSQKCLLGWAPTKMYVVMTSCPQRWLIITIYILHTCRWHFHLCPTTIRIFLNFVCFFQHMGLLLSIQMLWEERRKGLCLTGMQDGKEAISKGLISWPVKMTELSFLKSHPSTYLVNKRQKPQKASLVGIHSVKAV